MNNWAQQLAAFIALQQQPNIHGEECEYVCKKMESRALKNTDNEQRNLSEMTSLTSDAPSRR